MHAYPRRVKREARVRPEDKGSIITMQGGVLKESLRTGGGGVG